MNQKDIQAELLRLISVQNASKGGAIVIWHDPEQEFSEELDSLELEGVELLREEPNKLMQIKTELNTDLTGRKIVLWRPRARRLEDDWLADIELRAAQFAADYTSSQLNELSAADTQEMRRTIAAHKNVLRKKTFVKKLLRLSPRYDTPYRLELAIIAAELGADEATPESVVRTLLLRYDEEGSEAVLGSLDAATRECLERAVASWTGYAGELGDSEALTNHVLVSALMNDLSVDAAALLPRVGSAEHALRCHNIFAAWVQSSGADAKLERIACAADASLSLEDTFASMDTTLLGTADVFPSIDAAVLRQLFAQVAENPSNAASVLEIVASRRSCCWYERLKPFYEGVIAAARMQQYHLAHQSDMKGLGANRLWDAYTSKYYRMDTYYRELRVAFRKASNSSEYDLDEDFRTCCDAMENLYKNWYLHDLSAQWIGVAESQLTQRGYLEGIPRQLDFYVREVESGAASKRRSWVIASDALRYEVAAELASKLEAETKGACELEAMQAVLPSITKCGMPALLPHGTFSMEAAGNGLSILLDGKEATTTALREAQLRTQCATGKALTYDTFFNDMDKSKRKEAVGDADVVYLFHNTIDAIGDKSATEYKVFDACADAVSELSALVKLIVREFGASNIIITADHGFLYTDKPLSESDHISATTIGGKIVETGRRYVVVDNPVDEGHMVDVTLPSSGSDTLRVLMPRECVRVKMGGHGENYVHGGISLQEMCVPVLHFTNHRAGTKDYVETSYAEIALVSTLDVISNSIVNLEMLQTQPVGGKVLAAEYEVFVGDIAHSPVTDTARVVADHTEEAAELRRIRITLNLRPGVSTSESELYRLYAKNVSTGDVVALQDLHICVAFAPTTDFGW